MIVYFFGNCYNYLLNLINSLWGWGEIIRKLTKKQKEWLDGRSRKIQKLIAKKNKVKNKKSKYVNNSRIEFVAPETFSFKENFEETAQFFNNIINYRSKKIYNAHFFIDSSKVINVDVDAIMYLIAIISDSKLNILHKYSFEGNFPYSENAKKIYFDSGFISFVNANNKVSVSPKTNNIQIRQGKCVESPVAAEVCEFVQNNCDVSRVDTIPLYNILVEMMGNTKQHAYDETIEERLPRNWYLFAEEENGLIKFVFLDTGLGIPSTVQRNWKEKYLFNSNDSELIKSALNGEFRTKTKETNRGKGLPQISDCFQNGLLDDVSIFSGSGCCILKKSNQSYITKEYENKFFGTLFCWKVRKRKEIEL